MSMSTHICGFKPADEKWKLMKAIWDACAAAKVKPPDEVEQFFEGCDPDPAGVVVSEEELEKAGAVKEYASSSESGYEVDVSKLPKGVKILRFINSW